MVGIALNTLLMIVVAIAIPGVINRTRATLAGRKGLPFTLAAIEEHIHDMAGIRVICSYIDDIYLIADALLRQDDITLIAKKDYIEHPK